MHNSKYSYEQVAELTALVARLQIYQGKTADRIFCGRHEKFIGTQRTWRDRLCAGDFAQVDVEKKILAIKELIALLEGGSIPEILFETLPFNRMFQKKLAELEGQQDTDRRILCVLGGVGVGKTVSTKLAWREQYTSGYSGEKRVLLIISEALRENKVGLLSAIAGALNCSAEISGAASLMEAVKSKLSAEEYTVIFDEAHQGGVMLMKLIKDLVNHTKSRFVYCALQTEYLRVVSAARGNIVEAKQFVRRCLQPVFNSHADGTKAVIAGKNNKDEDGDATLYIQLRANFDKAVSRRIAVEIIGALRSHGNLSTLSDAMDFAALVCEDVGEPITPEAVQNAVNELCA